MQSNPSSVAPSQSSSVPLHVSGGGGQSVGGTQSGVQMARPVLPHVVVQSVLSPGTHSMQAPQVQAGPHGWTLGVPQDVVQGCVWPTMHSSTPVAPGKARASLSLQSMGSPAMHS